jgi:tRNA threonylcarbamoyladenosine biosynthesis protein TsaB
MAIILHIDTALETASIALSNNGEVLGSIFNDRQQDHAAWIHEAIAELINNSGIALNKIDAISVSIGPGSYTGLRVGLATAKGLCYTLQKPLIALPTLQIIAAGVKDDADANALICPLIDARRMEVYAALYNNKLEELKPAEALILDQDSFKEQLTKNKIIFCGSGSPKIGSIVSHPNLIISEEAGNALQMVPLAEQKWAQTEFADLAYLEPFYLKEFYTPERKL